MTFRAKDSRGSRLAGVPAEAVLGDARPVLSDVRRERK